MTYNRDLQEDKERLFDAADTVRATVRINAAMLAQITVNVDACAAAAADPGLLATDLADYLVSKGMPFRQAHHAVGAAVALAEKQGKTLSQLSLQEFRRAAPEFDSGVEKLFDLPRAMAARDLPGAPAPKQIEKQIQRWRKIIATKPK
jgi:argininosuccinate lyase